ncbi:MAG: chromosomal replication initiator protein DnaA, partial [Desulfatiglandales bacterium]
MKFDWDEIKLGIRGEIPENSYQLWIKPLKVLGEEQNRLILGCPNKFSRDWILKHYLMFLQHKFKEFGMEEVELVLEVVERGEEKGMETHTPSTHISYRPLLPNALPEDPAYTFENFVVGASNQFAYFASRAVADLSFRDYKILLMLSYPGLGKTHLTKAILNYLHQKRPELRVRYVTAEEFTSQLVKSIKRNRTEEFKETFRKDCDILLMEELHFLSGKKRTQVEFSHTMERLINEKKTIVITSCLPPKDIPDLSNEFKSRLALSLIASIEEPDFDTRYRIVQLKAKQLGLPITKDISTTIASYVKNDVRVIECILKYLKARIELTEEKISQNLVLEALNKLLAKASALTPVVAEKVVCKYFNVTPEDLRSNSKKKNLVLSRNVFAYLCRKHCNQSIKEISTYIKRAHSTVLHGLEALERDMSNNHTLKQHVESIEKA